MINWIDGSARVLDRSCCAYNFALELQGELLVWPETLNESIQISGKAGSSYCAGVKISFLLLTVVASVFMAWVLLFDSCRTNPEQRLINPSTGYTTAVAVSGAHKPTASQALQMLDLVRGDTAQIVGLQ